MSDTLKDWVREQYSDDELKDIVEHGCSGGFNGIIYYSETVELHDCFEDDIWELLDNEATSMGMSIIEIIASFNGSKSICAMDQLKNMLVWFAVETLAAQILNEWREKE